jgi:hypothetical protein
MFDDAEIQLEKILALVAKCPPQLQERCFEILLTAYVDSKAAKAPSPPPTPPAPAAATSGGQGGGQTQGNGGAIPDAVRPRFVAMAARVKVPVEKLASLFDFQLDPFSFHALAVPGSSNAEKTRNVALLLAAKGYLTTGSWTADWKEFRAACVDQACYDRTNNPTYMKNAYFKIAAAADGIALSSSGISAAEALLTQLTGSAES